MMSSESLFAARYPHDELAPAAAAWPPLIEQLLSHRSVRHYRDQSVSEAQLSAIIAAAQSASTSSNLQAWSVVAVREPATRAQLADYTGGQAHVRAAPLLLVWLVDLARLTHVARQAELPAAALDYLEMFVVGVVDAALAAQNALAAAESLGLAGCYIGALRDRPEQVAALLHLPPQVFAVFGMTLGYEDLNHAASIKPRLPQPVVLHHERYLPVAQQAPGIATYNEMMAKFYAAQNMNVRGTWSVHSAKRVGGTAALTGRDRLRQALQTLGFGLK